MDLAPGQSRVVKFGVVEADLQSGELRKAGMRQKLSGQPIQVLQALLEHPREIVTREQLRQRLWPDSTSVDYELGLKKAVNRLREALGDSANNPRFIETVPRQGYRFIGSVEPAKEPDAVPESAAPSTARKMPWRLIAAATLAMFVVLLFAFNAGKLRTGILAGSSSPQIRSLAVLPLSNLSGDPAQEYLSDGMTDALITELAQLGSLRVISRTSSMQYKQTKKSLPEIAHELNVDGIVEGTVQRSGDRLRITSQLIHGPTDKHLWANSYERDMRDVFALEREVAGDIAQQVKVQVTTGKHAQLAQQRPVNPVVLEAYLQGNTHMHKFSRGSGDEELKLASESFQQAIDAEPDFAPAYVGLSSAHALTLRSSGEDVEIASKAAERAVDLDPSLSDAWTTLGDIRINFWEWSEAEQDYRRALALNPNDANAHEHLGWILDAFGRRDEACNEVEIAQELDPNQEHLEAVSCNGYDHDQAIQHITTMLDADPDNGVYHLELYDAYSGKGMYKEAVQQLAQTLVLFGLQESADRVRQAFATSGYRGAMRTYAEELEHLHATNQVFVPMNVAMAYAAAGDKDRAFYWLEQGYKYRGHAHGDPMIFLNKEPALEPLRSDPRYTDLVRRVGLPP